MVNNMGKKEYKRVKTKTLKAIAARDFSDYLNYLNNTPKILRNNFLAGLARGFGMAIGFTVLSALLIYILTYLSTSGVPIIENLVKYILDIVDNHN